jgi:hypothetical protein
MKKAQASPPPDEEKFTQAFDAWLAARPKAVPSLKTFIASIKPKLAEARRKGVTYEQLAGFLREQGVQCGISTLKAYLAVKRRPKPGGKTAKNGYASGANASIPPASTAQPGVKGGIPDKDL